MVRIDGTEQDSQFEKLNYFLREKNGTIQIRVT